MMKPILFATSTASGKVMVNLSQVCYYHVYNATQTHIHLPSGALVINIDYLTFHNTFKQLIDE